jgi:hypothetical protein
MNALPDVRVQYVRVTNNTPRMWTDSYDGVPVTIEPGTSQNLRLAMAAHFFGWHPDVKPEEMMRHIVRRRAMYEEKYTIHGDPEHEKKLAAEMFADFLIEPVTFKLVEERPGPATKKPAHEPVPALTDEDVDERLREPTAVKADDDDAPRPTPYRGAKRGPPPGRKREE